MANNIIVPIPTELKEIKSKLCGRKDCRCEGFISYESVSLLEKIKQEVI